MEDKDFNKKLESSGVWRIASQIGIDVSTYHADSEDSLRGALSEIRQAIKKRQYENTKEQNVADFKKLDDKPNLQEEYKEIKKEEEPTVKDGDSVEQKAENKTEEAKEEPVLMGDLLRKLSGRSTKSPDGQAEVSELPNPVKTAAKTLNTTAEMINHISKMRDQRRS